MKSEDVGFKQCHNPSCSAVIAYDRRQGPPPRDMLCNRCQEEE